MAEKDKKDEYFQKLVSSAQASATTAEEKDQYDLSNFGGDKKEGRLRAKWNRIKTTFVGKEGFSTKFLMGFKMGGIVGGIFGTLTGVMAFYQTRNIFYVPLSIITMGASFGFFMGIGTVVRSAAPGDAECVQLVACYRNGEWVIETREPAWKRELRLG